MIPEGRKCSVATKGNKGAPRERRRREMDLDRLSMSKGKVLWIVSEGEEDPESE